MNKNKRIVRICGILLGLALSAASCAIGGSTGSSGMYSLSYEANSGDGIMEKSLFPAGEPGTLRKNTFTRDGYDFAGWALTGDGKAEYEDEDAFTNPGTREGPVILYAVWEESPIPFTITDTDSWNAAVAAVTSGEDNKKYIFTVDGDVGVRGWDNNTYTFGGRTGITVALRGTGKLYLTSRGGILNVNGSQTLVIGLPGDENSKPTLEGLRTSQNGAAQDNDWAVVIIHGTLVLNNGTISGNSVESGGGGVYCYNGSFIMNGGTISGNAAAVIGGGVYAIFSSFTMNGGAISDNSSTRTGGVYAVSSSFTMNGGTISDNTASEGDGGGVYVDSDSFITMNGGTISDNTAYKNGGGVYAVSSSFTMNGGTISDNTTSERNGGGVYVERGSFTMTGGTISGNTAFDNGGGVYGYNSDLTMTGGTISGNTASYNGGGVRLDYGSFTKSGGTIYGYGSPPNLLWNKAGSVSDPGHAVYCSVLSDSYYRNTTVPTSEAISTSQLPASADGYGWTKRQ